MDRKSIDFTLRGFRDLQCVYITFQMAVSSPLTLGASKTSRGLPLLAGCGRQHRSKVPRVLPEHRGPYAVAISRGLFRCRTLCICCTARLPHINTVDEQRLAALRLALSKVLCLFVVFCGGSRRPVWRVHAACMIGRPAGRRAQKSGSDDC